MKGEIIMRITLIGEDNEPIELTALEETRVNGINYLLATDAPDDEDGEAYILKDCSEATELESNYIFVEDDEELELVGKIFNELLDDDTNIE